MRHNLFVPVLVAILLSACSSQPADPPDLQLTTQERETLAAARQPESWFVSHLKGPREKVDGDLLNPKMQYVLETFSRPSSTPEAEQEERAAFATEEGRRAARASVDRLSPPTCACLQRIASQLLGSSRRGVARQSRY